MSKTKIVILSLKEIIYTAIFVGLGLLLILVLFLMFRPGDKEKTPDRQSAALYNPGVYTSQITLGENSLNLELVVDEGHINSIHFVNLEEAVTTMYPVVAPCLESISDQLMSDTPIENVVIPEENYYTGQLLLSQIEGLLEKASIPSE